MGVKELGHIVLYVRDLGRSRKFYGQLLGWKEIGAFGSQAAAFGSGRTHHELLLIEVGPNANAIPEEPRVGLYHFGLKIGTTDAELKAMIAKLETEGVPIVGTADHTVTHSVYIADPDGNEIELYIDVQPEIWRQKPEAILSRPRPLRI